MYPQHEPVDVEIGDGTLRVGKDVYPLKNIARAQIRKLEPRRHLVRSYLKTVAYLLVGTILITFAMEGIGVPGSAAFDVLYVIAGAWFVISTAILLISLPREKRKLTYYTAVIETEGTAQTLLADTDETPVRELVSAITAAISDPAIHRHLEMPSQLASAIKQYGKPGNRRRMTRGELTGPIMVVRTRGNPYRVGGETRHYKKAQEWLTLNGVPKDRPGGDVYVVSPDCKAFKRVKSDFDIDKYLRKFYVRRIDNDDPWFWFGSAKETARDRKRALMRLGHEPGQLR